MQNAQGYANLLKLVAGAHATVAAGPMPPQVSLADAGAAAAGLILLTGGADGPVGRLLPDGQARRPQAMLAALQAVFPDRLYVELQRHGAGGRGGDRAALCSTSADARGLPLVATNDVYFATADMYEAHDALLCIAEGAHAGRADRRRLTPEHWFKSAAEMRASVRRPAGGLRQHACIARRCAFMAEPRKPILPPFPSAATGMTEEEALRAEAGEGWSSGLQPVAAPAEGRAGARRHRDQDYRERLDYELDVIGRWASPATS